MSHTTKALMHSLINASNGHFFTVTFIKKDGTIRTMNCRTGVRKHAKGGSNGLDASKFFTVFDVQRKAYRAINKDTVLAVRVGGVEAAVVS